MFRVEVPIAAAQAPSVVAIRKPRGPATPLAGLTVLAIDNEPSILEGMRALLTGWGCEVITAASLDAALTEGLRGGHRLTGQVVVGNRQVSVELGRVGEETLPPPEVDAIVLDLSSRRPHCTER